MAISKTKELIRLRFHEAVAERDAIRAKAAPVRAEYEASRKREQEIAAEQVGIVERLKVAEAGLFELDNEIAMAARALKDSPDDLKSVTGPAPQ